MSKLDNVCIIDDDPISIFGIKRIMNGINFCKNITEYYNGQEAITAFKKFIAANEKLPSIIFLDLNMPIMDGWDFLEDFETLNSEILEQTNVYIISSSVDHRDMLRSKKYSIVKKYIIKPITIDDLNILAIENS